MNITRIDRRPVLLYLPFIMLVWVMLFVCLVSQEWVIGERERKAMEAYLADSVVTILFAGDVMGHEPQWKAAFDPETGMYDYHACFQYVCPYVQKADLACANLEVTLAGVPYTSYPCFSSPDALLYAVRDAGFDVVFTGNNHVLDHGKSGLERTIRLLDSVGVAHAGSYVDSLSRAASYPLLVELKGLRIGFLNMTYGTNGLQPRHPNVVNSMDTAWVVNDFNRLEELGADLKVVFIHWGNEYQLKADAYQRQYAQFLVDHGADLVIGGHPHVSQDADTLLNAKGNPVVVYYSMGNFVSNQRKPNTTGGVMVRASVNRFTGRVVSTDYIPYYVHRGFIQDKYQYYVIPTFPYINNRYDFSLSRPDSLDLITVHEAMTGRLWNFRMATD